MECKITVVTMLQWSFPRYKFFYDCGFAYFAWSHDVESLVLQTSNHKMSVSTPRYPNLQSSLNQNQVASPSITSAEVRLSQSEEFASDQNEFVFITDYNQVNIV